MRWLIPLLLACGSADKDTGSQGPMVWTAGNFDFYTQTVADDCLGGALEVLFMPEGPNEPNPFEYPIYLPATEELPYSATIDLRAPFTEMPVTIEDDASGGFKIRGAVMDSVELGSAAYGDCVVTMTVDVDLSTEDVNNLEGSADISISDPRGSEGRCPVFTSDDCTVALTLTAIRR